MNKPRIFNSITEFITFRDSLSGSVGFVPTMGALHAGHASLLQRSVAENDITILSIFVNPTQFNNSDDLKKYPRTWDADLKLAGENEVDAVLAPEFNDIYPDEYRYQLIENSFSKVLCGAHRPGHFNGVLTIVMKLLQMTKPERAYFGEKDFQQLQLIKDMARAFFLRAEIVSCETVREADGLAKSSRNVRLSPAGREKAPVLYKALTQFKNLEQSRSFLKEKEIELEYLEEHFNRRFIAAHIDGVRLIDNVELR